MTPAMGQADHAWHHIQAGRDFHFDHADARTDLHPLPVAQLAAGQILRMHEQLVPGLALHQAVIVMHPGIVAAHMAAADQQQFIRRWQRLRREAREVRQNHGRRGLYPAIRGFQARGEIGRQGPQVHAVGVFGEHCHRQLVAGSIAIHAGAQAEINHLRRWQGRLERNPGVRGKRLGQADEDLPVVQRAVRLGQDRTIETADIAHREHIEGGVVVIVFQRRGGRQDQVGITRRLVDVEIDADHEFQLIQGLLQLATIRRR